MNFNEYESIGFHYEIDLLIMLQNTNKRTLMIVLP